MPQYGKNNRTGPGKSPAPPAARKDAAPKPPPAPQVSREDYCRWLTAAGAFFRGTKPVRFGGDNWRL